MTLLLQYTLIFAAVVLSQLPFAELRRCKKGA